MEKSIPGNRNVLISGENGKELQSIIQRLQTDCPHIQVYQAFTYYDALQLILSFSFDLIVSEVGTRDSMGIIELAQGLRVPILGVLNGKAPPDSFKDTSVPHLISVRSTKGSGEVVTLIEQILVAQCSPRWKRMFSVMGRLPGRAISKMLPGEAGQDLLRNNTLFY